MATKIQKSVSFFEDTVGLVQKYPLSLIDTEDFSYKVNEMTTLLARLRRYTLRELKNYFTPLEAILICEASKGLLYTGELSPKIVLQNIITDFIDFENEKTKDVNTDELMKKIKELSEFQCYTALSMAFECWGDEKNKFGDTDEFAKVFMVKEE